MAQNEDKRITDFLSSSDTRPTISRIENCASLEELDEIEKYIEGASFTSYQIVLFQDIIAQRHRELREEKLLRASDKDVLEASLREKGWLKHFAKEILERRNLHHKWKSLKWTKWLSIIATLISIGALINSFRK